MTGATAGLDLKLGAIATGTLAGSLLLSGIAEVSSSLLSVPVNARPSSMSSLIDVLGADILVACPLVCTRVLDSRTTTSNVVLARSGAKQHFCPMLGQASLRHISCYEFMLHLGPRLAHLSQQTISGSP